MAEEVPLLWGDTGERIGTVDHVDPDGRFAVTVTDPRVLALIEPDVADFSINRHPEPPVAPAFDWPPRRPPIGKPRRPYDYDVYGL